MWISNHGWGHAICLYFVTNLFRGINPSIPQKQLAFILISLLLHNTPNLPPLFYRARLVIAHLALYLHPTRNLRIVRGTPTNGTYLPIQTRGKRG